MTAKWENPLLKIYIYKKNKQKRKLPPAQQKIVTHLATDTKLNTSVRAFLKSRSCQLLALKCHHLDDLVNVFSGWESCGEGN